MSRLTGEKAADIIETMENIQNLYSPEELPRLEKRIRTERVLVWGGAGLTLLLCVLFCCLTRPENARQMEWAAILCSTLGGWFVIYRRLFGLRESRYELQHARYLADSPQTLLRGKLSVSKERLRIKNSIRIRILLLDDGKSCHRLKVNETRVKKLRPLDGKTVTVSLAGGYVAGIGGGDALS